MSLIKGQTNYITVYKIKWKAVRIKRHNLDYKWLFLGWLLNKKAARVEFHISLAFLHWVGRDNSSPLTSYLYSLI